MLDFLYNFLTRNLNSTFLERIRFSSKQSNTYSFISNLKKKELNKSEVIILSQRIFRRRSFFNYVMLKNIASLIAGSSTTLTREDIQKLTILDIALIIKVANGLGFLLESYDKLLEILSVNVENPLLISRKERILMAHFYVRIMGNSTIGKEYLNNLRLPRFIIERLESDLLINHRNWINEKSDILFAKKICDKNILIIGPGIKEISSNLKTDIDNYDEIVVFNATKKFYANLSFEPTINYVSNTHMQESLYNNASYQDSIKFICVKSISKKIKNNYNLKIRKIKSDSKFWAFGYPNLLQYALYDLLLFHPSSIKVYGVDFFHNKDPYNSNYIFKNNTSTGQLNLLATISSHNLVMNYLYVKNLISLGVVEFDTNIKTIFDLGPDKYLMNMEELYGVLN